MKQNVCTLNHQKAKLSLSQPPMLRVLAPCGALREPTIGASSLHTCRFITLCRCAVLGGIGACYGKIFPSWRGMFSHLGTLNKPCCAPAFLLGSVTWGQVQNFPLMVSCSWSKSFQFWSIFDFRFYDEGCSACVWMASLSITGKKSEESKSSSADKWIHSVLCSCNETLFGHDKKWSIGTRFTDTFCNEPWKY